MIFSTIRKLFPKKADLHLKGYDVQEQNCVYTKKKENTVLLLTRSEKLGSEEVIERYKSRAAAVVGGITYLGRKNCKISPNFSEFEDSLFSRFTETSLFDIASGKYDFLLSTITQTIIKPGDYIHLRWGSVSEDCRSLLKLLSSDHSVLDRYWTKLKLIWGLNIGVSEGKPYNLKFVLKNLMTIQDSRSFNSERDQIDFKEFKAAVKEVYQAGLTKLYQRIPVRENLVLEEVLNQLHNQVSTRFINDHRKLWYPEGDLALESAFNDKTN